MLKNLSEGLVRFTRLVVLGALTMAPLLVTVWLASLLIRMTANLGAVFSRPLTGWFIKDMQPLGLIIELTVALGVLALVGLLANSATGRRIGEAADRIIGHVPVAKTVYRGVQKMLASFGAGGADNRKVVLIEFPSPEMKTIGLVTRRFRAVGTGQELAAVYVPTTPNPSSGYIEIVPIERLVWLDWSAQDAIQFIMSGGVIGPDEIAYETTASQLRRALAQADPAEGPPPPGGP